ncbi:glycolipid transfer protein domain-containing protein [Boletus reticuloceps]|uniref:Glycolipid transfer protein domain-containing protein n=1 Tax=Boletus reticuloceps TaxID=495285 RepID=A0A8I3AAT7_9AGAM|nr:glycolipid transfer protein domain-containing protein [Boletus reticuloceps]
MYSFSFSVAVPLSASYGYEVEAQDDPVVHTFKNFAATAIPAATPEQAVLLMLFPFLLRIPDWLPGSSLKREANRTRDLAIQLTEIPYRYAEERLVTSNERPITTMVSDHLTRVPNHTDQAQRARDIFDLKKTAVSSILAGSDTVLSTLMAFTLAIVLNPRVSKRAQAEIDTVVGTDRLPHFGDRPALPYVNATIREVLRWCPPAPLGEMISKLRLLQRVWKLSLAGIWHATSNSDVYNDDWTQDCATGTTVVANIWAMSRDEARFPNAEDFVPERFLNDGDEYALSFADVPITDQGIDTLAFLEASEGVVRLFKLLENPAFAPVVNDINGNITKVRTRYLSNPTKSATLELLTLNEQSEKKNTATEGMMWLFRGLSFTQQSLHTAQSDSKIELSKAFEKGYGDSLGKHHNFIVRGVFSLAMNACPKRNDFYTKLAADPDGGPAVASADVNGELDKWLQALDKNVAQMRKVYKERGYGEI